MTRGKVGRIKKLGVDSFMKINIDLVAGLVFLFIC